MRQAKYIGIIWILLLCSMQTLFAQKRNTLVIADDRLVLVIDLKSSPAEIDSTFECGRYQRQSSDSKKRRFCCDQQRWLATGFQTGRCYSV